MYTPQSTRKAPKMPLFFSILTRKVSLPQEIYVTLNCLTFENDRKNHLYISVYIIVYHEIYNIQGPKELC